MLGPDLNGVRAIVYGCSGEKLTPSEKAFFRDINPLGFILFSRNIKNPDQVRALVNEMRETVGREYAPVLIDQEGGPIARLRPPHWPEFPPSRQIGELVSSRFSNARKAARLNGRLLGMVLDDLGIDVNCAPVVDVPADTCHESISTRCFSTDPLIVSALAAATCEGMLASGVTPIMKHIPGLGRPNVDTHFDLPTVTQSYERLKQTDFMPFSHLVAQSWGGGVWAMTAHAIYAEIDKDNPATVSPRVIEWVIRDDIHFDGPLISDDLSMGALQGKLEERTRASIAAGVDILLHCNGEKSEMEAIAKETPELSAIAKDRLRRSLALRSVMREDGEDQDRLRAYLDDLMQNREVA